MILFLLFMIGVLTDTMLLLILTLTLSLIKGVDKDDRHGVVDGGVNASADG